MNVKHQIRTGAKETNTSNVQAPLWHQRKKLIRLNWELYLLAFIPVVWLLIFRYYPMYGNIIAFKRYIPSLGIWNSPWAGLSQFQRFFSSFRFTTVLQNTIILSVYQMLVGFPIPIILALMIHHCPMWKYKRTVQLITYAPHFISVVVIVGIIFKLLAPGIGVIPVILKNIGLSEPNFLGSPSWFRHVYVWSNVWQQMGWGSIIYLAALSGIDPELYEAAKVDGANIWRRIRHIDLPGIAPTITIILILRVGYLNNSTFRRVFQRYYGTAPSKYHAGE